MVRKKVVLLALLLALGVGTAGRASIFSGSIGTAIKVFGIGYAVRAFGPQINSFINGVLQQRGVPYAGTTKVVPILSIGQGVYIGAAQVAGPPSRVDDVKSVGQGEIAVGGSVRLKGLFPFSVSIPLVGGTNTVGGVGISALIDFNV